MILAIIPARGGSKRIPRKNIKPFCGKPMLVWSIEAARAAAIFDAIVVSTDDDEIAAHRAAMQEIAQHFHTSRDNLVRATTIDVHQEAHTAGVMLEGGVIQPLRQWTLLKVPRAWLHSPSTYTFDAMA